MFLTVLYPETSSNTAEAGSRIIHISCFDLGDLLDRTLDTGHFLSFDMTSFSLTINEELLHDVIQLFLKQHIQTICVMKTHQKYRLFDLMVRQEGRVQA